LAGGGRTRAVRAQRDGDDSFTLTWVQLKEKIPCSHMQASSLLRATADCTQNRKHQRTICVYINDLLKISHHQHVGARNPIVLRKREKSHSWFIVCKFLIADTLSMGGKGTFPMNQQDWTWVLSSWRRAARGNSNQLQIYLLFRNNLQGSGNSEQQEQLQHLS